MKTFARRALCAAALAALSSTPAMAQNIMGADQITPTTNIPNGNASFPIGEIADDNWRDVSPFNGFQGRNGATGAITLTFDQPYDVDQFFLWNDINTRAEGIRDFRLTFLNSSGGTVGTESFNAQPGRTPGAATNLNSFSRIDPVQIFRFPLKSDVSRVRLDVLSLQGRNNTYARRVEIREVAFNAPVGKNGTGSFRCYDLMEHKDEMESRRFMMVDQFGQTRTAIGHPVQLCKPVELNKRGATSEAVAKQYKDHLVCYELFDMDGRRSRPFDVRVENVIGINVLKTGHADQLCVTSTKEHIK